MDDVGRWLDGLGFCQYAATFAANDIEFGLLAELTEADLEKLGVSSLGHRKKLLKAIAALTDDATTALSPADPTSKSEAPASASPEAERRQLTVMFCDLVGSTALSERLDPEDLRTVIGAYQEACAGVIVAYDGYIARYMGDGLLVYFGYPRAHEDDAERAVHTGLGIVEAVGRLGVGDDIDLAVRVGIATGLVVVGDIVGEGASEERAVLGDAPNLAARLQGLAEPDSVLIADATRRLIEGLFDCEDIGRRRLKGMADPVSAFRVRGVSGASSRFEASAARALSPLIGRDEEFGLLIKRWEQACDGEGEVVLLTGDAGVGKSRIARALHDWLEARPHNRILYFCSPYHRNSALHPAIEQLERYLRFEASDGAEERLNKIEVVLTQLALPEDEVAPLLAALLSLPLQGRYPAQAVSPQLLRRRTLEALLSIIEAMAGQAPVLMVVEDAHWADPSTLEFLGLLIERLRSARVFLIVNSRPEFEPTWGARAQVTQLRLNRLNRKESAVLIAAVAGDKTLPDEVLERIVDRTDGVPLFIEELTKTMLESGLLAEADDGYALVGLLRQLPIPNSLQESLLARLDRLASVKEVAQLASTLGRTFSYELFAAVSPLERRELEQALTELETAGLIYRRGVAPDVIFEFKHALLQDAAYQTLLKGNRQRHHERIAQVLEAQFPATAESEPELLAHHYTEAGLAGPAVDHWHSAGQRAMRRSANVEAESHLRRGLLLLESIPDAAERHRREIALQNTLGVCLMPTRGFGNAEVAEAFSRAAAVSEKEGDSRGLFVALRGKGQYQMISGDLGTAREQASRILDLARDLDDPDILIEAHHLGWSALTFTGDFDAARRHAETGIALYDRERDHRLTYIYSGHDPGVCCRSFGSLALWQLGYPDRALAACRAGEALAHELSHPFTVTIAFWATGMLRLLRRETSATREIGESMIAHCSEKGFSPFIPMGKIFRGGALAEEGELASGVAELREGISGVRATASDRNRVHAATILCVDGRVVRERRTDRRRGDGAERRTGHVGT